MLRLLGIPPFSRPSSAACAFGRYCTLDIAVKTFVLVLRETVPEPFTTRDTVAVETPASFAMSLTVLCRPLCPPRALFELVSQRTRVELISSLLFIDHNPSSFIVLVLRLQTRSPRCHPHGCLPTLSAAHRKSAQSIHERQWKKLHAPRTSPLRQYIGSSRNSVLLRLAYFAAGLSKMFGQTLRPEDLYRHRSD